MNGNHAPAGIGKQKFLLVSLESLSGDLARILVKEGHAVKSYIYLHDVRFGYYLALGRYRTG